MQNSPVSRVLFLLLFAFVGTLPQLGFADHCLKITVVNNSGAAASSLRLTFAGSGGEVFVPPPSVMAASCPAPQVLSNPPVPTNEVIIDWGALCVPPGGSVTFTVCTSIGPLTEDTGFWGGLGGGDVGPIGPGDITAEATNGEFLRGETNSDGVVDIADVVYLLNAIFPPPTGPTKLWCVDAADTNDDGSVNIADAVFLLGALFGPNVLRAPSVNCGPDPSLDNLDCVLPTPGCA